MLGTQTVCFLVCVFLQQERSSVLCPTSPDDRRSGCFLLFQPVLHLRACLRVRVGGMAFMPRKSVVLTLCHVKRKCDLFFPHLITIFLVGGLVSGSAGVLLGRTRLLGGLSAASGSPCPALGAEACGQGHDCPLCWLPEPRGRGFRGDSWPGSLLVA